MQLLTVPEGAAVGTLVGLEGQSPPEGLGWNVASSTQMVKKKKHWANISKVLATDNKGVACWKGQTLAVAVEGGKSEQLTSTLLNAPIS